MESDAFIRINEVKKSFGQVVAIKQLSLEINRGELFGFIGPDGAGKTTLFRILTSLILPDSGHVTIGPFDVVKDYREIRKTAGYMPGQFSLYQDLTVEENLQFYASIFQTTIKANYDLIKDIYQQIEPFKKRRAGDLSGGMKQKLALSCALIHNPKLIILDEPTTGVDAVSRMEFWELLKTMQSKGITILVSTPYMDEAALCDKVALMNQGLLLALNTPDSIIGHYQGVLLSVITNNMFSLLKDLLSLTLLNNVYRFGESIHVTVNEFREQKSIETIVTHLKKAGHHDIQIQKTSPVIEDCFLALMHQ